jgi:hypothetical protein
MSTIPEPETAHPSPPLKSGSLDLSVGSRFEDEVIGQEKLSATVSNPHGSSTSASIVIVPTPCAS